MPTRSDATIARRDLVEGLGKGLRVIEAFDDDHPRLTASEAAVLAGITRTAARRHLLSLVHFGYAATDGRQFWLAPRVLRLGQSYLGAARLPRLLQPFIQRVSMVSGETINASVLDGHEVVYVARSNPPRWISIGYAVGTRVPAHAVTPGIVIVAYMPGDEARAWIEGHDFSAFTAHTVTDKERFRADLRTAHEQGYWATGQQLDPALRGLSVPLLDRRGVCKGAMGCTTPSASYTQRQLIDKLLPLLREAAQSLQPLL